MKKLVIIQEFGAPLAMAKKVIVVREQDIEESFLKSFDLKSFKDFHSFEKYLQSNSICILSNEKIYNKLIKSLSV